MIQWIVHVACALCFAAALTLMAKAGNWMGVVVITLALEAAIDIVRTQK